MTTSGTTKEWTEEALRDSGILATASRFDLWKRFVQKSDARVLAEIGILRGEFTASILQECDRISRYYMIDPWRHLDDWNKPANTSDDKFNHHYAEALDKTAPWQEKRVVLRGTTTEVIGQIPDGSLDFLYIDGDHTLRGIAIDLIAAYDKVRMGGWIAGDDFSASIWQHGQSYEPTMVFPLAVHFAEGMGQRIFALPHNQFLISKRANQGFGFVDLVGLYSNLDLNHQLQSERVQARRGTALRRWLR